MTDVKESAEIAAEAAEEAQAEKPEEEASCDKKEKRAEDETEETAAVHVTEVHREEDTVYAYDDNTGVEMTETTSRQTTVHTREDDVSIIAEGEGGNESGDNNSSEGTEENSGETTSSPELGETGNESSGSEPSGSDAGSDSGTSESSGANEESADDADSIVVNVEPQTKKTAEEMIAELMAAVNELKTQIAELKENSKPVFAELQSVTINPFVAEINTKPKYSLLEKAEPTQSFSLLEKA